MRLLELRKPFMKGKDVRRYQVLAKKHGVDPGPLDGEYGPRSAAAAHALKRRVFGYRSGNCHPVVGGLLMAYLEGTRKPTKAMLARAERRRKADAETPERVKLRRRALAIIKEEIGTLEKPNHSNIIKYTKWWGWGAVAYCVIGISWAWVKAGSRAFRRGLRWANTDVMLQDAKAGRYGLHLTTDPKPGCPGVVDLDGGKADPDHGITFLGYKPGSGKSIALTAEFNTVKAGTDLEGVWKRERPMRSCWWFVPEC